MLQSTGSRVIANASRAKLRSVTLAVLATGLIAGPALAQTGSPAPKAKAKTEAKAQSERSGEEVAARRTRISNSPHPTYDDETARRISAAMLSYSTLEVRGGWPALPAESPSSRRVAGPEVALLRQRLAITDDLAPAARAAATSSTPISPPRSGASSRATASRRPARRAAHARRAQRPGDAAVAAARGLARPARRDGFQLRSPLRGGEHSRRCRRGGRERHRSCAAMPSSSASRIGRRRRSPRTSPRSTSIRPGPCRLAS